MSTSKRRKRAYHHGDLRPCILVAATQLLEAKGVEGLSLREASRLAGVSHAAPYRHFPSKEALLTALAAQGFQRFREELAAAERAGGLRARGEAYVRFALANPQLFRLMFSAPMNLSADPGLREQSSLAFGGLQQAISAHAGEEAPFAAIAAWALVHGLAHLLLEQKLAGKTGDPGQLSEWVSAVLGSVRFTVASSQRSA